MPKSAEKDIEIELALRTRHLQDRFDQCYQEMCLAYDKLKNGDLFSEQECLAFFKGYAMFRDIAFLSSYLNHLEKYNVTQEKLTFCCKLVALFEQEDREAHNTYTLFSNKEQVFNQESLFKLFQCFIDLARHQRKFQL